LPLRIGDRDAHREGVDDLPKESVVRSELLLDVLLLVEGSPQGFNFRSETVVLGF
jgi:hypothetical protein